MTDIEKYLSFVLGTFVAFGVTFEVPVVVVVLVRVGIVELEKLREWRSYVIVGAFVVAAIFTPPDVISQLMMAIPLCLLYELGLFMARFVGRRPPAETPAGVPAQAAPAPEAAPAAAAESWQPASDDEMAQVVADLNRRKPD
jgi:sec-independent protein translocase protein TatC